MSARLMLPALLLTVGVAATARGECVCSWRGPFVEVQASTDLVIAGTVAARRGNSIDLKVERVLRGEIHTEQARVWLAAQAWDMDTACRAEPRHFRVNSQWVMALDRIDRRDIDALGSNPRAVDSRGSDTRAIDPRAQGAFNPHTPNISYGRVGDYSLSRCGGYWLSLSENLVTGNLTGGTRWEMNPEMTPVLLDLVEGHVRGELDAATLKEVSAVDPALQELILQTRLHLLRER